MIALTPLEATVAELIAHADDDELRALRADIDAVLVTREAARRMTVLEEHVSGIELEDER